MTKIFTVTLNPAVDRELTVPQITYDRVLRSSSQRVDFGGKGFNVSRMLKSLGLGSTAMGFVGGKSGELLDEGLRPLGIQTDFVWIADETRTNVSIKSTDENQYIKINEPGPTITPREQEELIEKISRLCHPGDWWVLAGSLPPGIPENYYSRMINLIQNKKARVIFDTSGKALVKGCQAQPFMIKPNDFELQELSGMPVDNLEQIMTAAKSLQAKGITIIVVSLGKEGALLLSSKEYFFAKTPPIKESNPIGAGDSMVGGMVWAMLKKYQLADILRWGVACGAAAASLSGTAVGSQKYVKNLASQTKIQKLLT